MSFVRKETFLRALASAGYKLDCREDGKALRLETACGIELFHDSIHEGNIRNVCDLIQMGISVNTKRDGLSPLHRAVKKNRSRIIEILVHHGADLYEEISYKSLLEIAVLGGSADAVSSLISLGLDPDVVNNEGLTLLYRAAERNHVDVAAVLLECGDFFTHDGDTLAHLAVERNCINAIRVFGALEVEMDEIDSKGRTPIYKAAELGNFSMIKVLVESGADILIKDSEGYSLLHRAARNNNMIAAKALLDAGINVDIRGGWWEYTPLHIAVKHGNYSVIKLLVHYKADVNAKTTDGRTPLDVVDPCADLLISSLLSPLVSKEH